MEIAQQARVFEDFTNCTIVHNKHIVKRNYFNDGLCRIFLKGDGTVIPSYLNGGDEVAIVSPFSRSIQKIEDAVRVLES